MTVSTRRNSGHHLIPPGDADGCGGAAPASPRQADDYTTAAARQRMAFLAEAADASLKHIGRYSFDPAGAGGCPAAVGAYPAVAGASADVSSGGLSTGSGIWPTSSRRAVRKA